jgi:sporulation protein YlmC with PRC-barrel domain
MDLVRDLLDKAIFDSHGREIGRADGVAFESDGDVLSVCSIDVGLAVLGDRLHPFLGRVVDGLQRAVWPDVDTIVRVPFDDVTVTDGRITLKKSLTELTADGRSTGPQSELTLQRVLGRKVLAANNRPIGRLEDVRADRRGRACVVTAFVIGAAGLQERLGVGVRLLFGPNTSGRVARSDQVDVTDPARLRLRCPVTDLQELR